MYSNNKSSILYSEKIVKQNFEVLSDVDERGKERPWSKHKLENEKILNWLIDEIERGEPILNTSQSFSFDNCGSWLLFNRFADQRLKLKKASFCKSRICPVCNWRRSLKLFGQVSDMITELNKIDDYRYLFLTLTLKNCDAEDLENTILNINYAFNKFTKKIQIKKMLVGYMKAVEITYNKKDNSFHPHLHCILQVPADYFINYNNNQRKRIYLTQNDFREIWKDCLKVDYLPQVDIRKIKNASGGAIAEVAKYPTKINSLFKLSDEVGKKVLRTFYFATKNKRLVSFGGLMKDMRSRLNMKDIETDDDLINLKNEIDEETKTEEMYLWRFGLYIKI